MHLGMGLICGKKIKDMVDAGFKFTIYLADWHSWINNKMGGDLGKIKRVGEYFQHCFTSLGVPRGKVEYLWASQIAEDSSYWEKVLKIAKYATLNRVRRALPIMGRSIEEGDVESAALFYPCMQVADIYHMNVEVACAGIDQRKAHMLARDAAPTLEYKKPISLHTPLLQGLEAPGPEESIYDEDQKVDQKIKAKMSKSKPSKCIYIHDSPEEIKVKIGQAYCPPKQAEQNPIIDIVETIIFPIENQFLLDRPERYGGSEDYTDIQQLRRDYIQGKIHPQDLKNSVSQHLSTTLDDVRNYFRKHQKILESIKRYEITR